MGKKHIEGKREEQAALLASLKSQIHENKFGKIDSLIFYRGNKKILEEYFNGYQANMLHEFQSVTKSIQAILIGLAIQKKLLTDINTPIKSFFPELNELDWSGGKDKITIKHLMQMTAGLEWNEANTSYISLQNHSNQLAWSKDWISFALDMPMSNYPGKRFNYSSANPIIISALLNRIVDGGNEFFVKQQLFDPLGIKQYNYHRSLHHPYILADVEMLPNDILKIGRLVQQEGIWEGKQLVSSNWIEQMLKSTIPTNKENLQYGYFWWYTSLEVNAKHFVVNYAWGYGSQHIFLVKELDLIMVCTGKNYDVNLHEGPFQILKLLIQIALYRQLN